PALDLQLARVGQHLPGDAGVARHGCDPLGARLEQLERAGVRVAALALVHERAHPVAGDRVGDEHDVAVLAEPGDALAAVGERVDLELQRLAALRPPRRVRSDGPRTLGHHPSGRSAGSAPSPATTGASSSSKSAFWAWRRFSAWSQIRWREP